MNIKDLKPGSYTLSDPRNVAQQTQAVQPTAHKSLLENVGNGLDAVFGGKQIGNSLGTLAVAGGQAVGAVPGGLKGAGETLKTMPTVPELIGDYTKAGANFIPGAGEGAKLATKIAVGAGTGYAMDVGSNLKNGQGTNSFTPGIATAAGGALPVAGAVVKPGVAILGRLMKGLGSGLSGVPVHQIDQIFNNPVAAQKATQQIARAGKSGVLEENAKTIINGVSKIRQEARQAFGEGLGALKTEDINPQTFRSAIQPVLEKYGSQLDAKTNTRILNNVEFDEPRNIAKAGSLIDKLAKTELNGLSLRKLVNEIDSAKYKVATSDERLSFNAFLNDLSSSVKSAVTGSTDKLNEINQKFSQDMQLAEATQGIFGKVKFKNLSEVNRASQKLEALFNQKGLSPEITSDFLKRIGVEPEGFNTSEAVRQLEGKEGGANSVGLNPGEVLRGVTSSIVTPEMVGAVSAKTGATKAVIEPFLKALPLPTRNLVLQVLLQAQADNRGQESPEMPTQ